MRHDHEVSPSHRPGTRYSEPVEHKPSKRQANVNDQAATLPYHPANIGIGAGGPGLAQCIRRLQLAVRRIFLSHTSELRQHPRERSFVSAAEAAVNRAGDAVTDMAYFTARESKAADFCQQMVSTADVYVGIIGFRYGSRVSDRPHVSYTELEFEAATDRGLPRLVFLLDEEVQLPLPTNQIIDLRHGRRQAAFRRRLQRAGTIVATIALPTELETRLYQALVELPRCGACEPSRVGLSDATVNGACAQCCRFST
jgi:hypothetical protein